MLFVASEQMIYQILLALAIFTTVLVSTLGLMETNPLVSGRITCSTEKEPTPMQVEANTLVYKMLAQSKGLRIYTL